jgi:hypothetical protein
MQVILQNNAMKALLQTALEKAGDDHPVVIQLLSGESTTLYAPITLAADCFIGKTSVREGHMVFVPYPAIATVWAQ